MTRAFASLAHTWAPDACLIALDVQNGRECWRSLDGHASYSAPRIVRLGDRDLLLAWTAEWLAGLDGVVASPHEVKLVREAIEQPDFVIVAPGVRPSGTTHDDQRRVMTPAAAVRAGADYLVVGRAILRATDPARAANEIIEEMQRGETEKDG